MPDSLTITTDDGNELEAELARADHSPRAVAVLCHPHPLYGGSMRSLVISALFAALPAAGVSTVRFNFRGVEGSGGSWDEGRGEQHDAAAALTLTSQLAAGEPLLLAGWSFGADMALSTHDPCIAGWLAIAPPLRYARVEGLTDDPRPKLLALAEHDEFRDPAEVVTRASAWANTEIEIVGGASHFFVGRTDRLVDLALGFVDRLAGPATAP